MPFTSAQLTTYFSTLSRGATPDAATTAAITTAAAQNASGAITDLQALQTVTNSLQIRATTDVAVSSYALFTGATPTQAGIDFLVNSPGTGYNTIYYNGVGGTATAPAAGGFNLENRYFNAAINLAATPSATGNAAFLMQYGGLTVAQTVATAYNNIIGISSVGATAAAAAIAAISAAIPYFTAVAAQRAPQVNQDSAVKAIILGYILEEAIKADVGIYARALDGFNAALAMNTAIFNTNLVATYGAGGAGFNTQFQPLADMSMVNAASTAVISVGVAPNAVGQLNLANNSTINLTGDIATNSGQLIANVANATTSTTDVLTLAFTGQNISNAASIIAAGVETVNVSSILGAAPAGTVLSLDLQDSALRTLNLTGNESIAYSAPLYAFLDGTFTTGALATINASTATAPVTIDVSSVLATNPLVTVTGTTGVDTFLVRNATTVTGNGGNDVFLLYQTGSVAAAPSVTDDHAGVMLGFVGQKATTFRATALTVGSLQDGVTQAAAAGPGVVSWFQTGGDTYVVADASAANTFQVGSDFLIRLVGAHNLTTSTVTSAGLVVLGG